MHHATPTPDTYIAKTPTRIRRFRSIAINPVVLVLIGAGLTLVGVLAAVAL